MQEHGTGSIAGDMMRRMFKKITHLFIFGTNKTLP